MTTRPVRFRHTAARLPLPGPATLHLAAGMTRAAGDRLPRPYWTLGATHAPRLAYGIRLGFLEVTLTRGQRDPRPILTASTWIGP